MKENIKMDFEYNLSNNDIKFPALYEDDLDNCFRKEKISKDILMSDLSQLINNFQYMVEKLTDITKNNLNNFHSLCLQYKVNIYDLIVMLKLNKELAIVVLSKFKSNNEEIKLSKYEDFYPNEKNNNNQENINLMEIYHKNIDTDYSIIKEKTALMFQCIKEIYETKEESIIHF